MHILILIHFGSVIMERKDQAIKGIATVITEKQRSYNFELRDYLVRTSKPSLP